MASSEVVLPVAIAVLSGGFVAAVGQVISARAQLKKAEQDDERLPAEVGTMWLGGAEKAVAALQVALDRADAQITRLEAALDRERQSSMVKDERIAELERQLTTMRRQLTALQTQADRLGVRIDELKSDDEPAAGG